MSDEIWMIVRYILIALGSFLVGKGYVTMDQVNGLIDALPQLIGGIMSVGTMAWGLYVKYGTKSVPAATAARADVPTVSSATGKIEPATSP